MDLALYKNQTESYKREREKREGERESERERSKTKNGSHFEVWQQNLQENQLQYSETAHLKERLGYSKHHLTERNEEKIECLGLNEQYLKPTS